MLTVLFFWFSPSKRGVYILRALPVATPALAILLPGPLRRGDTGRVQVTFLHAAD